jgi:hypothetical protein
VRGQYRSTETATFKLARGRVHRIGDRMDGFVERVAAVETEMKKLTDIAVALARYDERILAMTTRLNLMDKRWEELRERQGIAVE